MTEVQLLQVRGKWQEATDLAASGIELCESGGDQVMRLQFQLHKTRGLLMLDRLEEAEEALRVAVEHSQGASLVVRAEIESLRGKALAMRKRIPEAASHYERALRVLSVAGSAGTHAQVASDYTQAIASTGTGQPLAAIPQPTERTVKSRTSTRVDSSQSHVQATDDFTALASLIDFAEHPALLGNELITLLLASGCKTPIAVISRTAAGKEDVIAFAGGDDADATRAAGTTGESRRIPLGSTQGRALELLVTGSDDLATETRLHAIEKVLQAGLALQRSRREQRDDIASLPVEPVTCGDYAIFAAPSMLQLLAVARKASTTTIGILITGETGTGKEILAQTIHESSPRRDRRFIPFNCVSVPREMLDSQLFGHRKGAFTGANEGFSGVIRAASGGTLFLDEIGELPMELQPKLLRFMDTREVHPIGETMPVKVDVRVIAATNRNLDELVQEGRFREDLYYRLNILRFAIPPLRERREEIPVMVKHFLRRSAEEFQKDHLRFADETLEYLVLYRWPGNVRQLVNEIRRMAALAEPGAVLMPEHLDPAITANRHGAATAGERRAAPLEFVVRMDQPLATVVEHVERTVLPYALTTCKGSLEDAARMLGLTRKGLYLKRQRLGL